MHRYVNQAGSLRNIHVRIIGTTDFMAEIRPIDIRQIDIYICLIFDWSMSAYSTKPPRKDEEFTHPFITVADAASTSAVKIS
jgi:hypothetical protein